MATKNSTSQQDPQPAEPTASEPTAVEAVEPATPDIDQEIRNHLADPQRNPLPEGVVINFGDPVPFRKAD